MSHQKLILVTGASGFIGQAVVQKLLTDGEHVRALVRHPEKWKGEPDVNLELVQGDMRDAASLERAMKGVTYVVHLAAAKSDEAHSELVNVEGARLLGKIAKTSDVKHIVNISTQSAKLCRPGAYGRTKAEADRILQNCGVPVTTLRCSLIYGDTPDGAFGAIVRGTKLPVVPIIGQGNVHFRPMHRDALAEVIAAALKTEAGYGKMIDTGGSESLSFDELTRAILAAQGKFRPLLHIPIGFALMIAKLLSFLPRSPLTISNVRGAAEDVPMDVTQMHQFFGITERSFADGLLTLFPPKKPDPREAPALLRYVLSAVTRQNPLPEDIERYDHALIALHIPPHHLDGLVLRFPILLGGMDAATKLLSPHCILQKKLLIAAAVMECTPASAEALLPRERSKLGICFSFFRLTLRTTMKLVIAIPLFIAYPFYSHNAGHV